MKQFYRILIINVAFIGNATCMKMMAHSVVVVVVVVVVVLGYIGCKLV